MCSCWDLASTCGSYECVRSRVGGTLADTLLVILTRGHLDAIRIGS